MAKIANKLTDLVCNTPLMELSGYSGKYGLNQNIIAKLEAFNPAGSVKDRVAGVVFFYFVVPGGPRHHGTHKETTKPKKAIGGGEGGNKINI